MARYIDADALKRKLIDEKSFYPAIVASALEETPTADVVEIPCRCNECKSFVENKEALVTYCTRECKNLTVKPSDGFCESGERK